MQKCIFNIVFKLLNLVKSLENPRKFGTKNRNMKTLDL
jgi:hypothetical protein